MAETKNIFWWLPNTITSISIVCGISATFFAIDGHLGLAGIFIILAAILDFLDGFAARLLKAYSEIGKQLDSLADMVSFGVAPAAILFTLLEVSLFGENNLLHEIEGKWHEWAVLCTAFLIPIFAALRLAKFNIDTEQSANFKGLPTPANAILWASFGLMLLSPDHAELTQLIFTTKNLVFIAVITSLLMVSGIPMFSLKFKNLRWKNNWYRYLYLSICITLLIWLKVFALQLFIVTYILLSFLFYLLKVEFE